MKRKLIQSIREKEQQLANLKKYVNKNSVCSDLYNKVVLEKAILKKELENLNKNKLIEGIKNILPSKKTLICDYFKR